MIDGGIQIAHEDVKMVGGVAVFRACRPRRWRPMSVVGSPSPMTGQAHTHNFTTLDAAADRGSVPTTDFYGDPIAVNNAGTILSETEVSPPLWNVDPTDWVRTACTIAGRVCTPITAIPVNCPETIAGL